MSKAKERACIYCGKVEETFSKVPFCQKCYVKNKKLRCVNAEVRQIEDWGYDILGEPEYNNLNKRVYKIRNRDCGHEFSTTYGNLKTGMSRNDGHKPCGECGKKRRTRMLSERNTLGQPPKAKEAFAAFRAEATRKAVERRKTKEYEDQINYRDLVRLLSDAEFRKSYYEINPDNLKRGREFHLDHIVSIDYCFKNQIPAELCASKENLRMIEGAENVAKKHHLTDDAKRILESWGR